MSSERALSYSSCLAVFAVACCFSRGKTSTPIRVMRWGIVCAMAAHEGAESSMSTISSVAAGLAVSDRDAAAAFWFWRFPLGIITVPGAIFLLQTAQLGRVARFAGIWQLVHAQPPSAVDT